MSDHTEKPTSAAAMRSASTGADPAAVGNGPHSLRATGTCVTKIPGTPGSRAGDASGRALLVGVGDSHPQLPAPTLDTR